MADSASVASDLERVRSIRALIADQDLLICLYPHLFAVKQMARLAGIHSRRQRVFVESRSDALGHLHTMTTVPWLLVSERLSDSSGLTLLSDCRRLIPSHRSLLLLNRPSAETLKIARQLGVDALLDERSVEKRSGALIQALAALQEGSRYEDPRLQADNEAPNTSNKTLSGRQLEILALVAEGLSNRVIAQQLQISSNTVRDHLSEIMLRLNVSNRASAVSSALRRGLMP